MRRNRRAIVVVLSLVALSAMAYGFVRRVGVNALERVEASEEP